MKRAQRKDLLRELKHSLNRYLSIMAIMALGVAFYAGVRSAEPDMQLIANRFLNETDFMDIRVIGTMGLTDGDVAAIEAVDGIARAEGAYYAEAYLETDKKTFQLKLYSIGENVNKVELTKGRMPENASECLMDEYFMEKEGYQLGDTITLSVDEDAELSDTLNSAAYTIVGAGKYAEYLSWERGTVSIGTGSADGFLFLQKNAFASEVYTSIYATVEDAKTLNCYGEEYEELIDRVQEAVEGIEAKRCEIRYEEALAPAWEEIADAEQKIADAEAELKDAEKEIADAEAELADGRKELEDGKKELSDKEVELADAKREAEDGWKELESAEAELETGRAELSEGQKKYEDGKNELIAAKAVIAEKREELEAAKQQLEAYGMPLTPELIAAETELAYAEQQLAEQEAELAKAEAELLAAEQKIADGEKELADGRKELLEAEKKITDGEAEISKAKQELADAETELADGEQKLADAKAEYEDGITELSEKKQELLDAKKELEEVERPEWYVLGRDTVQSLVEYGMDTERIGKIGKVFPAVFYLVAALVSLTTMTRMIEEERTQIGTMKALGYGKASIASKYLWYSLSATLIGSLFGVLLGSRILPAVIIGAYKILYAHLPEAMTPVQWDISLMSVLIAVICTVIATLSACYKELASAPSVLMRPAAPKEGKRVFLEYITILWKHLSFSWKATCRNLFRYKKRFFMTIFGIGGCMALLMVGFGLRDSIADIVNNQYKKLWTYDAYLSINDTDIDLSAGELAPFVKDKMFVQLKTVDLESETAAKSAEFFVPERLTGLEEFLKLTDRKKDGVRYELTTEGVILSEKLANILEVGVGDTIFIKQDETHSLEVTVTAVVENYLYHYIYMSPEQYLLLYGEEPEYNQMFLQLSSMSEEQKESFSKAVMAEEAVDSVTYVEDLQEHVDQMMQSLNLVVVVLIVAAALLAFIVLYNLNNINIIERRRELATIKVLGFFDGELAMYVYRENILLTIFGILFGVVLGIFLHRFVILTCEIDMIMFGRDISALSYASSVALTALFSVIVNFGMFYKLRRIDMVESLKSME
ncbi:MAG: FtsX-like permease family protein [Lachnospiraceae bacterium]